jgi:hypothetical protein
MPQSLLADVLRGDPERKPEDFKPPESAFAAPGKMKTMPALKWRPGMLFLGVLDGELKTDADGRRFVTGGTRSAWTTTGISALSPVRGRARAGRPSCPTCCIIPAPCWRRTLKANWRQ